MMKSLRRAFLRRDLDGLMRCTKTRSKSPAWTLLRRSAACWARRMGAHAAFHQPAPFPVARLAKTAMRKEPFLVKQRVHFWQCSHTLSSRRSRSRGKGEGAERQNSRKNRLVAVWCGVAEPLPQPIRIIELDSLSSGAIWRACLTRAELPSPSAEPPRAMSILRYCSVFLQVIAATRLSILRRDRQAGVVRPRRDAEVQK